MSLGWTVYLIENSKNGKGYVGLTSKQIERRFSEHVAQAFPGRRNPNGTLYALHAALQKYGPESFTVRALEKGLNLDQARRRERDFIQEYSTYGSGRGKRGYNQTLGGELPDEQGHENEKLIASTAQPKEVITSPSPASISPAITPRSIPPKPIEIPEAKQLEEKTSPRPAPNLVWILLAICIGLLVIWSN